MELFLLFSFFKTFDRTYFLFYSQEKEALLKMTDLFLDKGIVPFTDLNWTLWQHEHDLIEGRTTLKLVVQRKNDDFNNKEKKEILFVAHKLSLKYKKDYKGKMPKLIIVGNLYSIYIEYF